MALIVPVPPGRTFGTIFKGKCTADEALLSAGGVSSAAPTNVAFLFRQRFFVNGMLEGDAKE
ncbi:hypothetical protein SAMN02745244_02204 [Tessaracoccus bendigoensis DSM 12906]|uniref:Uncharacterized protein n=1 Tax=Tessaracoccus bendigoensis DSM 12906 TaxID=1123357 RepID=A0A1M6I961_9ACTN|nr:hypothetical protein [Tessaracoccus bendigoensis]SHJ30878.1 hypothetical protein SAMN02745244_02204 [Tessaracoccus bendigoensis DSM 12906]